MKNLESQVIGYRPSTNVGIYTSVQGKPRSRILHKLIMLGRVQQQQNIRMIIKEFCRCHYNIASISRNPIDQSHQILQYEIIHYQRR